MRGTAPHWALAVLAVLFIWLLPPTAVPAGAAGALNPYDLLAGGAAPTPAVPAAPSFTGAGLYGNGFIETIPTEHLTGHVDADWGYNWDYAYDIGVSDNQVFITLDIQLTGYDPGDDLRNQWLNGIQDIWSNQYQITDGTYDFPIVVNVNWVDADADQVVTVYEGDGGGGIYNMNDWYTELTDWGNDYQDEAAAHEAGHMFGLYDEYEFGATTNFYTSYDCLMADLQGPVQERYFEGFLAWMEDRSGQDLSLAMVGASPGVIPYEFKFTYSNGDYYTGTVWAGADYYLLGDYWEVVDDWGETGAYEITGAGPGVKQAEGLVFVTSYFDNESRKTFTPLGSDQMAGSNYLGNEWAYIIDSSVPQYFFGAWEGGIYEADLVTGSRNSFIFYYDNGDYYTGTVYADPASFRYYQGYRKYTTDENHSPGYYEITGVEEGNYKANYGRVFVNSYYEAESQNTFAPVNSTRAAGTKYLGSEVGYILKANVDYLRFGSYGGTFWEADVAALYAYTYYFGNGDFYRGTMYARFGDYNEGDQYLQDDETTPTTGQQGYYEITGVSYVGYTKLLGQVFVSQYWDVESQKNYTPIGSTKVAGKNYLGSELGYICAANIPYLKFGQGYYEADVAARYDYTYHFSNGDSYRGTVYALYGDYQGDQYLRNDETTPADGPQGYYEITGVSYAGYTKLLGQVFVSQYWDVESLKNYTPIGSTKVAGKNYLGSELGYIVKANVNYLKFGQGYWEADVAAMYNFAFYYGNGDGDYYYGVVYAAPGKYQPEQKIPAAYPDENGKTGYYQITGVTYLGYTTLAGQVMVTNYFDQGLTRYTPVSKGTKAVGKNYLGSEVDYLIKSGVEKYRLGFYLGVFYEADVQ